MSAPYTIDGDDMSSSIHVPQSDGGVVLTLTFTRAEPDSSDDERRAQCDVSGEINDSKGNRLYEQDFADQWFVNNSLRSFIKASYLAGDFDPLVSELMKNGEASRAEAGLTVKSDSAESGRAVMFLPDKLMLHVWHNGDSSVGLPGDRARVELDIGSFNQEDRHDYVEQAREQLEKTFSALWGTRAEVKTSEEIRAIEGGTAVRQWVPGDKASFGRLVEVEVFAGLFRVSGFGMGTYYSTTGERVWLDAGEAAQRAKSEGIELVQWDVDSAPPAGYKKGLEMAIKMVVVGDRAEIKERADVEFPERARSQISYQLTPPEVKVRTLASALTFTQWNKSVKKVGSVNGWALFDDQVMGGYVLMTSYNSAAFATEEEARDWAHSNRATPGDFNAKSEVSNAVAVETVRSDDKSEKDATMSDQGNDKAVRTSRYDPKHWEGIRNKMIAECATSLDDAELQRVFEGATLNDFCIKFMQAERADGMTIEKLYADGEVTHLLGRDAQERDWLDVLTSDGLMSGHAMDVARAVALTDALQALAAKHAGLANLISNGEIVNGHRRAEAMVDLIEEQVREAVAGISGIKEAAFIQDGRGTTVGLKFDSGAHNSWAEGGMYKVPLPEGAVEKAQEGLMREMSQVAPITRCR